MSKADTAPATLRQVRSRKAEPALRQSQAIRTLEDARISSKAALAIAEVALVLELDPRTVSAAAAAGDIPSVRLGRRVLIPRLAFLALFDTKVSTK